jgi:hypothetical protein
VARVDFLVAKDDLHRCRVAEGVERELDDGQALLAVEHFGLTSNNITYALLGEAMSYWDFFPAEDGWGRVPMWGFASVTDSLHPELAEGARVYGYLPPSAELTVNVSRVQERGFVDAAPHRAQLPAAYNAYALVDADPVYDAAHEDAQMLLRPLFFTSYLIDDFLDEANLFDATTVVISSASSKTASGLAYLLSMREGVEVVALTSARSREFVANLGVYDHVVAYDEPGDLPAARAVYVDIAGDAAVRAAVHEHYGQQLAHSAVVGATHHDRRGEVPDALPGPRPTFFFAPDRIAKRAVEWGREGLEQRLAGAWHPYVAWTESWLRVVHERGPEALQRAYLDVLDGRVDPACAHVLTLR